MLAFSCSLVQSLKNLCSCQENLLAPLLQMLDVPESDVKRLCPLRLIEWDFSEAVGNFNLVSLVCWEEGFSERSSENKKYSHSLVLIIKDWVGIPVFSTMFY